MGCRLAAAVGGVLGSAVHYWRVRPDGICLPDRWRVRVGPALYHPVHASQRQRSSADAPRAAVVAMGRCLEYRRLETPQSPVIARSFAPIRVYGLGSKLRVGARSV